MPDTVSSIRTKNTNSLLRLERMYPAVGEWMKQNRSLLELSAQPFWSESQVVQDTLAIASEQHNDSYFTHLTQEECDTIIQKLKELATLPGALLDQSTKLYVEQQITDIVGIGVSFSQNGYELPLVGGMFGAAQHPHISNAPDAWPFVESAGQETYKAHFLKSPAPYSGREQLDQYQYTVTLPLSQLPQWQQDPLGTKTFFADQKVIIINPFTALACVATIVAVGPDYTARYAAMASPALVRDAQLWSYASQGHSVILFVEEPNRVQCGPRALAVQPLSESRN